VAVPIYSPEIRKQIKDIINIQLSGNTKLRILDRRQENHYKKAKPGEKKVRVQDEIYRYLKNEKQQAPSHVTKTRTLIHN